MEKIVWIYEKFDVHTGCNADGNFAGCNCAGALAGVCISCCNSNPDSWLSQQRQNKPVFFMLAEEDQLVEYEKYDSYIKHIVGKQSTGKAQPLADGIEFYPASEDLGAPVVTYYYPGRHRFEHDAMPYIVEFFKSL